MTLYNLLEQLAKISDEFNVGIDELRSEIADIIYYVSWTGCEEYRSRLIFKAPDDYFWTIEGGSWCFSSEPNSWEPDLIDESEIAGIIEEFEKDIEEYSKI